MKYSCDSCKSGVPDTSLRATASHPLGEATCPHCHTTVARTRRPTGLLAALGVAAIAAILAREPFEPGEPLYWALLVLGFALLAAFLTVVRRSQTLKVVSASSP